ncbi:MAG TPA: hypothetical protein VHV51_09825, partial [Polyangiaceae bacterium]|nr:hypothetical protein [Polyangiaceae bacterium]
MRTRERGGFGKRVRGAVIALCIVPVLSACAPVYGGAALVAVVGIGVLSSHCYDYLDVSVFDEHGLKTCAATVTARNGGDEFELKSCYYAPLTDGHWTIRAVLPGYPAAAATVDVDHASDCTRYTQSMELTLNSGSRAQPAPVLSPLPPPPPAPAAPSASTPVPPS